MKARSLSLVALYGLSGAVGLAWQVVQVRAFLPVFGAGAEAIAAVTACFLGGLGLGAALAPRLLRRASPLRVYGLLELVAGLWGAALPWVLGLAGPMIVALLRSVGDGGLATLCRLLLAALLVGPMALALGATFPAVAAALDADRHPDRVGLAYGVNAIGAAAGALLAGLWLPWALGLKLGALVLGLGNGLVGLVALRMDRGAPAPSAAPPAGVLPKAPPLLWGLAFATGFIGMGLEICWSRVSGPLLAARSGSDAVAFSVVLAAVVLGIGLGGVAARRVQGGLGKPLALVQAGLCVSILIALEPVRELILGDRHLELVEGLLPLFPALLLGATFPLLSNALAESGTPASAGLARLYAVNTAGAVSGSLLTGFLLMPTLGAQRLLVLLAGGAALVAAGAGSRSGRKAPLLWAALVTPALGFALWVTPPVAGQRLIPPFERVLDSLEGRQGSTLVSGRPEGGERALTSGGHRIGAANKSGPVNDHELRARGPAGLHKAPERVLLIGMGTGATAEAFLALPTVQALTVVELDSNMRRLLPYFGTQAITDDPRLQIVDGDGRWFIRADEARWDVIAVDAFDPRTASATFYTADFYAEARARLAPGGLLFVKFNPASVTEPEPLAGYLATLWSVFPDGALVFVQRGLFGLVGTLDRDALVLSPDRIVAESASGGPLVVGARLHSDDRPLRLPDRPAPQFGFIEPYWQAGHGAERPPWAVAGPRPGLR